MLLPFLYHWSPADRHDLIARDGLVPGSAACIATAPQEHLCLSPDPSQAWALSGGVDWHTVTEWDLWQVRLAASDEVHVRPMYGPLVEEINVRNPIPVDRVWWVARRSSR